MILDFLIKRERERERENQLPIISKFAIQLRVLVFSLISNELDIQQKNNDQDISTYRFSKISHENFFDPQRKSFHIIKSHSSKKKKAKKM